MHFDAFEGKIPSKYFLRLRFLPRFLSLPNSLMGGFLEVSVCQRAIECWQKVDWAVGSGHIFIWASFEAVRYFFHAIWATQHAIIIPHSTYQSMLGMFHPTVTSVYSGWRVVLFSVWYEDGDWTSYSLWRLWGVCPFRAESSERVGQQSDFLGDDVLPLDRYIELVHGKKDKRVSIKAWMDVIPSSYLQELRANPFTKHPDSIEAVGRFC